MTGYDLPTVPVAGEIPLPNGCTLFWQLDRSVNCRVYCSDEIGGGVEVWNTALVDQSTLLAAIVHEERLCKLEYERAQRAARNKCPIDPAIIVGSLANGMSVDEVERQYGVTTDDVRAALRVLLNRAAHAEFQADLRKDMQIDERT